MRARSPAGPSGRRSAARPARPPVARTAARAPRAAGAAVAAASALALAAALVAVEPAAAEGTVADPIDIVEARPSAERAPAEVVDIVLAALQGNGTTEDDAGIATVFAFASPGNRAATGPFERFRAMIKRGYSDMLGFAESRTDELRLEDDAAFQVVWLRQGDGRETGYVFQLGRQSGGEYDGMWMTDAVYPIGEGPRSGTSI